MIVWKIIVSSAKMIVVVMVDVKWLYERVYEKMIAVVIMTMSKPRGL